MNILIFTRGTHQDGMGHVQRQLVLAGELIKRGHHVDFLTFSDTPGLKRIGDWIGANGYDVELMAVPNDITAQECIMRYPCTHIIIDIEHGPTRRLLEHAGPYDRKVIVIDGVGFSISDQKAIDDLVDLQVYQSVALNEGSKPLSKHLIGLEYVIIDQSYHHYRGFMGSIDGTLISMGGADPHELTRQIAEYIGGSHYSPIRVVIGPAALSDWALWPYRIDNCEAIVAPSSLASYMASSTTLITALGMTVYEALCVGIPVACTAWSADHEATALKLESMGAITYLGQWDKIDWSKLITFLNAMQNEYTRQMIGNIGMRLVDGLGVKRVVDAIEAI